MENCVIGDLILIYLKMIEFEVSQKERFKTMETEFLASIDLE